MKHVVVAAIALPALIAVTGCSSMRGPGAAPTPQRPRLSHNTATTAAGTVELETGLEIDPSDFVDTPTLVKFGLNERTEFVVGGSPLRHIDSPSETGLGDVVFGARHRLYDETADRPAIAIATQIKLPLADAGDGLGTGETDVLFSVAGEKQIQDVRAVAFYRLGLLGSPVADGNDIRHDLAGVATVSVAQNLDVYSELGGVFIPEYDFDSIFLTVGGQFELGPTSILDAGFRLGITDDAPDFTFLVGLTLNLGASPMGAAPGN